MNRKVHSAIGIILFLAYAYLAGILQTGTRLDVVDGILGVLAGSLLPDILEPPTSGRHRSIFHSWRALKVVAVMLLFTSVMVLLPPDTPPLPPVFGASCFFLGYLAHLLADSLTRAGLPG